MNEIERAEAFAQSIVESFERKPSVLYHLFTFNYELACEEGLFQELVIQQIRLRGYLVERRYDEDGINIRLKTKKE